MTFNKYSFTFDPNQQGIRKILGPLESDIMEMVWQKKEATVREIHDWLSPERDLAYTTVMTIMSRLAEKGLLNKRKENAAYVYSPVFTRKEFTESSIKKIIKGLLSDFTAPTIAEFLNSFDEFDDDILNQLEKQIEKKRKEKNE